MLDMQGRKIVSNAAVGLTLLHDVEGGGTRKGAFNSTSSVRASKSGWEAEIDHPVVWDGTGRAQYTIACHRLQVRPNPSVIHQLGQADMIIDIGSLVISRFLVGHSPLDAAEKNDMTREQLIPAGTAIIEALHHNSLATSIRWARAHNQSDVG